MQSQAVGIAAVDVASDTDCGTGVCCGKNIGAAIDVAC